VTVKLVEAVPLAGALRFEMRSPPTKGLPSGPKGIRGQRRLRAKGRIGFRR
jgi:hypothetical protein